MERAISWICRGECVRAFLRLLANSLIGRNVTLRSRDEFGMRIKPCIAVCRCYEKAHRKAAPSQISGNFCPQLCGKARWQKSTILSLCSDGGFFGPPTVARKHSQIRRVKYRVC